MENWMFVDSGPSSIRSRRAKRTSEERPTNTPSRVNNKRVKLNSTRISEISKAEQTLLQGAADFFGLTVDQLIDAVDRYGRAHSRSASSTDGKDSRVQSESTVSVELIQHAGHKHDAAQDAGPGIFRLTLPDLAQSRRRRPQRPVGSGRHPNTTIAAPRMHLSLPPPPPAPLAERSSDAEQSDLVAPWLSDMLEDDLQWGWNFQLDNQDAQAHDQPSLYSENLNFASATEVVGAANPTLSAPDDVDTLSPLSLPADQARSTPNHDAAPLPAVASTPLDESAPVDTPSPLDAAETKTVAKRSASPPLQPGTSQRAKAGQARKRGPFPDAGQRQETGIVRLLGACIRCSMQRIRCKLDPANLNGCCLTCSQAGRTRAHWVPCLRYKISDAELLDHEIAPRASWTVRWKKMDMIDIATWANDDIKNIVCTQDVLGTKFQLKVRRFSPVQGDSLARKWKKDGKEKSFECPPYAIANMKEAAQTLATFVDKTMGSAICFYIDETDKLMRDTFMMAYRQSKFAQREDERQLLTSVLRLWAASRLACRSDRICGSETLGMEAQDYGTDDPNSGIILTPPVLSAQMEVVITATLLLPARNDVLSCLQKMIQGNERRSWFAIYLAMFVLLQNCALLTQGDNKKARKQGYESRFFRTSLVESLHNGAKVLLAYFHYCNKGNYPFRMDWTAPDRVNYMELDEEQVNFMRQTSEEISAKSEMFDRIREEGSYEHDYYFVSQLYDVSWKPVQTI